MIGPAPPLIPGLRGVRCPAMNARSVGSANLERGEAPVVGDRLYRPDLLLIGATSRNSGKTELACQLIGRHAPSTPIVGLKVTAVERVGGGCPHGESGCGVCSSLLEPWEITREVTGESSKDTARMLASGARWVYWMQVLRAALSGGAADLLTRIPSGWLGVCESTSLREVVEPGLFLLVRAAASGWSKPSARAMAPLADRVVVSDGRSFDLDLDRISIFEGQWALRRAACAVVIDGAGDRRPFDDGEALRATRASLEAQFDRVVAAPGAVAQGAPPVPTATLAELPEDWCLVTPPMAGGVPPGLVNALYRRREEIDVVVGVTRSAGRDLRLALCRPELLPEVIDGLGRGAEGLAALADRWAARELRLPPTGPRAGSRPPIATAR